jgi:hypothetical protein
VLTQLHIVTIIINVLRGVAQMGARVVWDHEVAGSIPVTPTIKNPLKLRGFFNFKLNSHKITKLNLPYNYLQSI